MWRIWKGLELGKRTTLGEKDLRKKGALSTRNGREREPVSPTVAYSTSWAETRTRASWHQCKIWLLLKFELFFEIMWYSISAMRDYLTCRAWGRRALKFPSLHYSPWRRAVTDLQISQGAASNRVMRFFKPFSSNIMKRWVLVVFFVPMSDLCAKSEAALCSSIRRWYEEWQVVKARRPKFLEYK